MNYFSADNVFQSATITLSNSDDTAHAGGGNDVVYGLAGRDRLWGDRGNDRLDGGSGADSLAGGAGNDTYYVDSTGDRITEDFAGGIDTVRSNVSFNLGGKNLEKMVLTGTSATHGLGNSEDNSICGNRISNVIDGRDGDDTVTGWNGNDTVSGGAGNDLFRFKTPPNAQYNVDRITDFVSADDRIGIDNNKFGGLGADGALAASKFHLGSAAHDSSDRIIYDRASGKMSYDADGNGSGHAILFAQFDAGTAINLSDMFVL